MPNQHTAAPLEDRFWSRVDKSGDCWNWTAGKVSGYGAIKHRGKRIKAHRLSWMLHNGPIPEGDGYHGTCVLHKCDNRACVNPDHLFLGTNDDNMRDMAEKGRTVSPPHLSDQNGSKNRMAKLCEDDIPRIRDMLRCGAKRQDIADWFGVTYVTISNIDRGLAWMHV